LFEVVLQNSTGEKNNSSMHPDDKEQSVELGYELGKAWWNQGLMTEAVRAVIDFFLDDVGMQLIYASHSSDNPA